MILLPCTITHTSSIPMGAMYLYKQEHFLHSLTLLKGGHMMLVIAQLYLPRQYKSFYLTIIDIFYFVFNSQLNYFVFPIFTVTENYNEDDNSI